MTLGSEHNVRPDSEDKASKNDVWVGPRVPVDLVDGPAYRYPRFSLGSLPRLRLESRIYCFRSASRGV